LPFTDALGAVFLSGWFYWFFTLTGLRGMLFQAVPPSLRSAITVGIGFFITMIGLKIGQITDIRMKSWAIPIVYGKCNYSSANKACANSVDVFFSYYDNLIANFYDTPAARLSVLGIAFVAVFETLKIPGAIITSIALTTLIGINYMDLQHTCHSVHDTLCVTRLDGDDLVQKDGGHGWAHGANAKYFFIVDVADIPSGRLSFYYANTAFFWDCVWTFLFVELFDSFGTITAVFDRCGFIKVDPERAMDRVNRAMIIDGMSLWIGGIIGANSVTCYIESITGVEAGAKTGLASVVTGCAFWLSLLFVKPFVGIIPDAATCCALVMVGVHSLKNITGVNFNDIIDQMAAFLTIATMVFIFIYLLILKLILLIGLHLFHCKRYLRWIYLVFYDENCSLVTS